MSDDLPIVGRPRGSAWRQLLSEGILWEGQILVAGGDTDLAALLIVTNERLALIRGGAVALDIRHEWLSAPPSLRRTGTVGLQVLTPGQRLPESLILIVREGRLAAAELVEVLTPQERYEPEFPTWNSDMFLEEEPIIPARPAPYERKHSPAPVDPLPPFPIYASLDDDDFPPIAPAPDPMPDWSGATQLAAGSVPPPDVNVIPRVNEWNLKPLDGMDNKDRRNRRAWAMRLAAVFLAVAGIAAWQGGLLPDYASMRDRFADNTPEIQTVAQLPAATPTELVEIAPTETAVPESTSQDASSGSADQGPSSTQAQPTYAPAEQTALALGVGGGDPNASTSGVKPASTEAPIIQPPDPTQTPQATEAPADTAQEPASTTAPADSAATSTEANDPAQQPVEPASASSGALDFEISDVQQGESLPDLTLGPLNGEEWVVVTVDVKNAGADPATLDMSDFKLETGDGTVFDLDSATGAVATFLGKGQSNGTKDTREIGPSERASVVLVFVPPADSGELTLKAGEASLPLQQGASSQIEPASQQQSADALSTQLLTTSFQQYDVKSPTATANAKIVPLGGDPATAGEE